MLLLSIITFIINNRKTNVDVGCLFLHLLYFVFSLPLLPLNAAFAPPKREAPGHTHNAHNCTKNGWGARRLEGEQQQEGHHKTEQTHSLRQGETQDGIGKQLLFQRWVSGITNDEGTEYWSDTSTCCIGYWHGRDKRQINRLVQLQKIYQFCGYNEHRQRPKRAHTPQTVGMSCMLYEWDMKFGLSLQAYHLLMRQSVTD